MFALEGLTQSALGRKKMDILILNELHDGYIENLAALDHNFYIITDLYENPQWVTGASPSNLSISKGIAETCVKSFDLIICFGRGNICDKASELSDAWHIPMIIVDTVSSSVLSPSPFFSQIKIENKNILYGRNVVASVAINNKIKESWPIRSSPISVCIPHSPNKVSLNKEASKILIDPYLPERYIDSLPIEINNTIFTTKVSEAAMYLHMWQSETPLMIDSIISGLPVVTFKSDEMLDILEDNLCITIKDIRDISPTFVEELKGFEKLPHVMEQVEKYDPYPIEEFKKRWESVLGYARNNFYMRG